MFIDARTVPAGKTIQTDVCIVGAGAAGITLALEFAGQPFRVCLLESGGFEFDEDMQSLYDGETVGLPYTPLKAARVLTLGGPPTTGTVGVGLSTKLTSNHATGFQKTVGLSANPISCLFTNALNLSASLRILASNRVNTTVSLLLWRIALCHGYLIARLSHFPHRSYSCT
jgi:hypothetical protein